MTKTFLKRSAMYILIFIGAYLAIGYLFHLIIFPEKKPEVSTYFKPGQQFYSSAEKVRQTIVKQENGIVYCSAVIEPLAGGPPKHIHTSFDETFEIENGELSIWINGEVKKIHPGEKLFIPAGTPHKPFNETGDTIRVKGLVAFPEKFAYHLAQVYGFMDNNPGFQTSAKTPLQLALFASAGFDSYIADGPPVVVQKLTGFLLTPALRLFGFKSFYEEYDINRKAVAAN